jgi:hypothetical protein
MVSSAAARLNAVTGGRALQRLRIGVADEEFDSLHIGADHVGDGVSACPADTDHGDLRSQIVHFGWQEFDTHRFSLPSRTN